MHSYKSGDMMITDNYQSTLPTIIVLATVVMIMEFWTTHYKAGDVTPLFTHFYHPINVKILVTKNILWKPNIVVRSY